MQKSSNISGIANEKSGPPAWKQLPTWYQVSENDHVIPPAVERMFAKEMNATTIVSSFAVRITLTELLFSQISILFLSILGESRTRMLQTYQSRLGLKKHNLMV